VRRVLRPRIHVEAPDHELNVKISLAVYGVGIVLLLSLEISDTCYVSIAMSMLCLLGCSPNDIISRISDLVMKLVTMDLLMLCSSEHAFVMVTSQSDGAMRCKL
jgi:hypothetical protein